MTSSRDTIFALSSGRPPAAIAVIRISGPRAGTALEALTGRIPPARKGVLGRIRETPGGEMIDEALVLWFPGPNSETGEDVAELQLHGGPAVIAATLRVLGAMEGLRLAEGGEFTRRGFENGKLDLTAVEGLGDLIAAETDAQRRQAFRQMKGLLGDRAETWRRRLVEALALVEARIDFSDEADVPEDLLGAALTIVQGLRDEIAAALADGRRGERLRDGLVAAVTGPPNAGKSTLLNRLARRDVAIVSPVPGTTRDVIEVHLDLNGYPVTLLDTAGIRESADPVEQEGIRRARQRAEAADLILWLSDSGEEPPFGSSIPVWKLRTKVDLLDKDKNLYSLTENEFSISSKTDINIHLLIDRLSSFAASSLQSQTPALVTRERHRGLLQATLVGLTEALAQTEHELVAESLRRAADALGRLTGRIDVEDVLDVIFRDFCIGK